jgi:drug/metabolite transporter (DMT)-like permease
VESPGLGQTFGILSALTCALAWTLLSVLARTLAAEFSTFSLNIARTAAGSVLLTPLALVAGDLRALGRIGPLTWLAIVVSVLLALGVGDTAFFESAKALGLSRAMTISTAGYPLAASALAAWWLGEVVTPVIAAGSALTLGGLAVIVSERDPAGAGAAGARRRGLALAFVATLAWAVSAVLMKPPLREIDPLTVQAIRLPLSALLLWATPWARGTARAFWARRRAVGAAVLGLGALTALSALSYLLGLKYAGVTLGTVLSSVSPLFALPLGLLAFGERITWRAVAGAVMTVAGIVVLSL